MEKIIEVKQVKVNPTNQEIIKQFKNSNEDNSKNSNKKSDKTKSNGNTLDNYFPNFIKNKRSRPENDNLETINTISKETNGSIKNIDKESSKRSFIIIDSKSVSREPTPENSPTNKDVCKSPNPASATKIKKSLNISNTKPSSEAPTIEKKETSKIRFKDRKQRSLQYMQRWRGTYIMR